MLLKAILYILSFNGFFSETEDRAWTCGDVYSSWDFIHWIDSG